MLKQRIAWVPLILVACHGLACQGRLGDPGASNVFETETETPEGPPQFALGDPQPQVLPFWVRIERVSGLVGRPTSDPMFDLMKANRYSLGDYNYGANTKPDRLWSARMMTEWIKALRPICSSSEMKALYPELGSNIDPLVALASDAYGRDVLPSEVEFSSSKFESLPDANKYELSCLAVLSSAEFVLQ